MKTLLYILILSAGFISCKSVNGLVQKGKYDEAFTYGVNHLAKKKNKKTEEVMALEKAFAGLKRRDLQEIERLSLVDRPENASKIVAVYDKLTHRQDQLTYFLPMVSEDGYEAYFEFTDYSALAHNARENAAMAFYTEGKKLLSEAEKYGDKDKAKSAYYIIDKTMNYVYNFKDVNALKKKALDLGHKYIYVETSNKISGRAGQDINHLLWNYSLAKHDDMWHSFRFADQKDNEAADMMIRLEVNNLSISPELENNYYTTEQKEIFIRSDKKMEKRDSVLVEVIRDVYETVSAKIVETFREKHAVLEGNLLMYDTSGWRLISNKPVRVTFDFNDRGMVFTGDKRALSEETKNKLDSQLAYFPADEDIVVNLIDQYKNVLSREASKLKS